MKLLELKQGDKFIANGDLYILNKLGKEFAHCEKLSNGGTWKIRLHVEVERVEDDSTH